MKASSCCTARSRSRSRYRYLLKHVGQLIWLRPRPHLSSPPYCSHHFNRVLNWIIDGTCSLVSLQPLPNPCLQWPPLATSSPHRQWWLWNFCATYHLYLELSLPLLGLLMPICCLWARTSFRIHLNLFRCGARRRSRVSSLARTCQSDLRS